MITKKNQRFTAICRDTLEKFSIASVGIILFVEQNEIFVYFEQKINDG